MVAMEFGDPVWALGLMSGTSLDGVDAALLCTDGVEITAFGPGAERPYAAEEVAAISAVMADPMAHRPPETYDYNQRLRSAAHEVLQAHAHAVIDLLCKTDISPSLIGFHGQTVAHAPDEGWTWQVGDGAALAHAVNRPVVWDFRTADMEMGGEGAPLAPVYHWALARHIGADAPVAFLNLGGVGNVTWVDPAAKAPESEGALIAFDTGPANALINDWMLQKTGEPLDRDGAAAAAGTPDLKMAQSGNALQAYLQRPAPKSLDRNDFSSFLDVVRDLSVEDGAATLTALTASCVAASLPHLPSPPARWLICGGGRKNPVMMAMLAENLAAPVDPVEAVGLSGDLLEAQAFAYLAVRSARGLPLSFPGTTGCGAPATGGRLSEP